MLSKADQQLLSYKICRNILRHFIFVRSKRIGLYLAHQREVDLADVILQNNRKDLYAPVINKPTQGMMSFNRLQTDRQENESGRNNTTNIYGIEEPEMRSFAPIWSLSCVLVPLVAFDRKGARLGMGGGYYDRAFASLANLNKSPQLVGVAYGFQELSSIPTEPSDVRLDYVVTEEGWINCQ